MLTWMRISATGISWKGKYLNVKKNPGIKLDVQNVGPLMQGKRAATSIAFIKHDGIHVGHCFTALPLAWRSHPRANIESSSWVDELAEQRIACEFTAMIVYHVMMVLECLGH